jgi:hypothetical protein
MAFNPLNIINTLLPSFAIDSVAIFTQDYIQLFRDARAIKAVVKEQAKVMEHPVENGSVISDHRVILPVEIELSLILASENYQSVYKAIRQYYFNATLLVVQTRSGIYENQLISALPHEEDPTIYDALTIALSLKQVQFVTAQFGIVPKYPSNTTTVNRGVQQGTPASTSQFTYAQHVVEGKPL